MIITAGKQAPDFSLPDQDGIYHQLSSYRGSIAVLYFYPKDDTPGCTKEACNFRDDYRTYREAGVVILGVSPDSPKKHTKFKSKYDLPFTLLSDENHEICDLYGVWGAKKFMGRSYYGVFRTTFLINKTGDITHVFEKVKPSNHSEEILEAIKGVAASD